MFLRIKSFISNVGFLNFNVRLSIKHILFKAFPDLSINYRQPDLVEQINHHLSRDLHRAAGLLLQILYISFQNTFKRSGFRLKSLYKQNKMHIYIYIYILKVTVINFDNLNLNGPPVGA